MAGSEYGDFIVLVHELQALPGVGSDRESSNDILSSFRVPYLYLLFRFEISVDFIAVVDSFILVVPLDVDQSLVKVKDD